MADTGISGIGITVVSTGALLMYAAITDQSPLDALRQVASGGPSGVANRGSTGFLAGLATGAITSSAAAAAAGGALPELVPALQRHAAEKYSQLRRNQAGYSDCSSFIGNGLRDIGIKPPGLSTTASYLASSSWRKIARSEAGAGDLAVNTSHMACFINNSTGIGQENPRRNVVTGDMDRELMAGTGSYVCLRYAVALGHGAGGTASGSIYRI
jgi:hypothetical protein